MVSLFVYDNDTFVLYPYVDADTHDSDVFIHIEGAKALTSGCC